MILAVDVCYDDAASSANAAGVIFTTWSAERPEDEVVVRTDGLAPYIPGQFVVRELPCILPVVEAAVQQHRIGVVVVDGFVDLVADRPGLGRHLYERFQHRFEVVGVAKSPYLGRPGVAVLRGTSAQPLWVTSTGDAARAADNVRAMAGPHRIPDLLRRVDQLARARQI
jgi:deoxyribonuclease V